MLPLAWRPAWLAGAVLIALLIVVGSLLPSTAIADVSVGDKFQHALAYGVLALWLCGLFSRNRCGRAVLASFALGCLVELLQAGLTDDRVAELADLLANGIGIAVAFVLAWYGLAGWAQQVERRLGAGPPGGRRDPA
jgi:hypothetical protein